MVSTVQAAGVCGVRRQGGKARGAEQHRQKRSVGGVKIRTLDTGMLATAACGARARTVAGEWIKRERRFRVPQARSFTFRMGRAASYGGPVMSVTSYSLVFRIAPMAETSEACHTAGKGRVPGTARSNTTDRARVNGAGRANAGPRPPCRKCHYFRAFRCPARFGTGLIGKASARTDPDGS